MIAVDTSALIAILVSEPGADRLLEAIMASDVALIGRPILLELRLVADGKSRPALVDNAFELVSSQPFRSVDFGGDHLAAALDAFDRYGKGRHPAKPNYGDCMAYAIAKVAGCPRLYKGVGFARTDIVAAG